MHHARKHKTQLICILITNLTISAYRTQLSLTGCMHLSKKCFESQLLLDLAQKLTSNQSPDPLHCLTFETDGLDILHQLHSDVICQLNHNVSFDVLEYDLKVVLNTVAVDSYYENIVMKHFRSVLRSCMTLRLQV